MSVKALESLLQMSVKGYNAVFIGSHLYARCSRASQVRDCAADRKQ